MIFFDVTKVSRQDHHSGLVRVSRCLRAALRAEGGEDGVVDVVWHARRRTFVAADRRAPIAPASGDWLLTPELFSEEERPGLTAWLQARPCRAAAVYHDAIPLQHPEFTWPQSVARHPYYLKLLGAFDQVIANSAASARELEDYWRWLGVAAPSPIPVTLGADGNGRARAAFDPQRSTRRSVVMIGILEPRKNQAAVLDAAEQLWTEGVVFDLHFVGRVNPHFGRPIAERIRAARRRGRPVKHESALDDAAVEQLLAGARFALFPSLAEGCGLPVLEALWSGLPVICSDLPALLETATGGGCLVAPRGDPDALARAMRDWLADERAFAAAAESAAGRPLPRWRDTAQAVLRILG